MIRRLLACSFAALVATAYCQDSLAFSLRPASKNSLIAAKQSGMSYPQAAMPNPDKLIPPAGEATTWPIRADGQPFVLDQDVTVNFTDALNRYYFDPRWRGEEWGPFNNYWIVERAIRLMNTWEEYDQFSTFRIGNGFHKVMEKYSGYGP